MWPPPLVAGISAAAASAARRQRRRSQVFVAEAAPLLARTETIFKSFKLHSELHFECYDQDQRLEKNVKGTLEKKLLCQPIQEVCGESNHGT